MVGFARRTNECADGDWEDVDRDATDDDRDQDSVDHGDFQLAHFPEQLGLPSASEKLLRDAAVAIAQEFRDSSRWKRLTCRRVSMFAQQISGTVCILHIDGVLEFDWRWEGSTAFCPRSLQEGSTKPPAPGDNFAAVDDEILWMGEVLEVDERHGCLFVAVDDANAIPSTGSFYVRPFEYLSVLDDLFNAPRFQNVRESLPPRLAATMGGIHPRSEAPVSKGLPKLQSWWRHAWNILWGPPGTGKTFTIGQQLAAVLDDPSERVLVVSTTNRATDAVALSIGKAVSDRQTNSLLDDGALLRVGKGAQLQSFTDANLEAMLPSSDHQALQEVDGLINKLRRLDAGDDRAITRKRIAELRAGVTDTGQLAFVDGNIRLVVATAFRATTQLNDPLIIRQIENHQAPFTTVVIDEAGLMSRVAIAALSLLAARRVVLVGDSKQLAPISRISRILPTCQQTWLANSGLGHLDQLEATPKAVHVLSAQHRMHPDVCQVVSTYQYGGFLKTASARSKQTTSAPAILNEHSRAIWYVLDEEDPELAAVRAERGPGNKSWLRTVTPRVLEKLFADDSLRKSKGVFVSPFTAQTQHISQWFAQQQLDDWDVTTVHSQQGSEADVVIFDTVNASSSTWPYEEWRRLINVALSRAREAVIVLASRGEMREPYLRPLLPLLKPSSLVMVGDHLHWQTIATTRPTTSSSRRTFAEKSRSGKAKPQSAVDADQLGAQIAGRQQLKPILSSEQQRLVNLKLDGKPRLVRGVAGSGKSVVLCNWLAKTVRRLAPGEEARIWAVFANRSLHHLLRDSIDAAWQQLHVESLALFEPPPFPWEKVTLLHVKDVLAGLLPSVSLSMDEFKYDYDRAAEEFLQRQDVAELLPRCTALFIDEAQDMGPSTLKLLLALVDQTDHEDANSRSAHIFYDNDQNVYGRKTPKWSEMGLDLRGRSSVMRESFRSTVPILELALNVLKRLTPDDAQDDRRELIQQGLIKQVLRDGEPWLQVAFSHLGGPRPTFHACLNRDDEMNLLGSDLVGLIRDEHVLPRDICLIYTGQSVLKQLQSKLEPGLRAIGVELSVQTNRPFEWRDNTLMATTPHSFKGYEAEIIIVPNVDTFVVGEQRILAHALYVAMTRARSMLKLYGTEGGSPTTVYLLNTIRRCIRLSNVVPTVED